MKLQGVSFVLTGLSLIIVTITMFIPALVEHRPNDSWIGMLTIIFGLVFAYTGYLMIKKKKAKV
jgi:hypothetical protein